LTSCCWPSSWRWISTEAPGEIFHWAG
jgi:hypothetical protein